MAKKSRFVLNRKNFSQQILHNKVLLDDVQEQMEGMAQVHPSIKVYRNEGGTHGNVVATAPAAVEAKDGVLTQMINQVKI